MPKINIPIGYNSKKDLSDESRYLSELIYKIGRTNIGLSEYTSVTSGIHYSTDDYPNDNTIYNKGDIGLINLFHKLYGNENGFIVMAEDINNKSKRSKTFIANALSDKWYLDNNTGMYTQTIEVDGMVGDGSADYDILDVDKYIIQEYEKITMLTTHANNITLYAIEQPTENFSIKIIVNGYNSESSYNKKKKPVNIIDINKLPSNFRNRKGVFRVHNIKYEGTLPTIDVSINGDNSIKCINIDNNNIDIYSAGGVKASDTVRTTLGQTHFNAIDLQNFDFSEAPTAMFMFSGTYMTMINILNADFNNAISGYNMFNGCILLDSINLSNCNFDNAKTLQNMFAWCWELNNVDLSNLTANNTTNISNMFEDCYSLSNINLSNISMNNVTNMKHMFSGCSSLTSIDLYSFNTSNVTDMSYMFYNCLSLISLDMSNLNTSKVTNIKGMFSGCESLTSLDLSSFNTSNVTDMGDLFGGMNFGCSSLKEINLSNFDTSKVTNMSNMFKKCSIVSNLDLSTFNTSSVTNMASMFADCTSLSSLNLSSFDVGNVTNMSYMFEGCESFTKLDLSNFTNAVVTKMDGMFRGCKKVTSIDISGIDTSNVTDFSYIFADCDSLLTVYCKTKSDADRMSPNYPNIDFIYYDVIQPEPDIDTEPPKS